MTEAAVDQPARLMLMGNIVLDLTVRVARLPTSGEDVRGHDSIVMPGGGFNVLHAAWRSGLLGRFAGSHGTGSIGDRVRGALTEIECEVLQPPLIGGDSGWVVALVEATGERTFVSSPDAVVPFDEAVLESLHPGPTDLVYVSGYSLGLAELSAPLATWVSAVPASNGVFCDLGPWGAQAPIEVLGRVLARVDWLGCNGREATRMTGKADLGAACEALQRRTGHGVVLVRAGAQGCWVATPEGGLERLPAPEVREVVDTNGAGDTHSGVFLAAVAAREPLREAVMLANAAASQAVTRSAGASWEPGERGRLSGQEG